ncbi:MAG TPA: phage terminase large subunit family protein, partial [Azospirillaceae bacterium]|nr:phage terminase large subunit family protein [Azospirillaceae bacterium]
TVKTRRGFTRLEWQKVRERNEALDCRVYARAAAWIAGADRWTEDKWRDLENQIGPAPDEGEVIENEPDIPPERPAGNVRRPPPRRGRRVFRSSYVS